MGDRITYVGLDVHKDGIVVAVAEGARRSEVREYGRIANTPTALQRLARKLGQKAETLRFCYEAGPCLPRAKVAFPLKRTRNRTPISAAAPAN